VTFPEGAVVLLLGPATAALNVTDCPATEGFCDDVTVVVVAARVTPFTVCINTIDVDPA
jgi:hypothetical protein